MKSSKNFYENILLGNNSKKIIDNAVIQSFSANFHFDSHFHSTVELFICLEGSCTVTIQQSIVSLKQGSYIVIFPNSPHSFDSSHTEKCTLLQIHFFPDVFMDLFSDTLEEHQLFFLLDLKLGQKNYLHGAGSSQLYSSLHFIHEELCKKSANYSKMVDLYLAQLLILISRDISHTINHSTVQSNRHIRNTYEYLSQHFSEKISVENIAEYCGISSRFLTRIFQEHLDMNISTYITYFRINKAIDIMTAHNNEYPLTQLALDVGFSSVQYFSKVFRSVMDISPSKYFKK